MAVALADVGKEGQGRLGLRTAVVGEFRLNSLGAADSRKIVGVARVIAARGQYLVIEGMRLLVSYPIVEMTQAGVWVAETMLARATKARTRVDLNSMMQGNKVTNWNDKRESVGWRYRAANRRVVKTVGSKRATVKMSVSRGQRVTKER